MPKTVGPVFKPRISRLKRFLCVAKRERGVSGKSREYSQVARDKIGSGRVLKPSRESAKTAASVRGEFNLFFAPSLIFFFHPLNGPFPPKATTVEVGN